MVLNDIHAAVKLLRTGKVVAFPTETVYGLGADASNPLAVQRIFQLKERPSNHPLIVHIADPASLDQWACDISDIAYRLAERFWPGPLTIILPKAERVPLGVTGGQNTIGLRIPDHPLALDLLRAFGGGLAAPSANRFGRISPTSAMHVRDELGDGVEMVLDGGPCQIGLESTIISLIEKTPRLLRLGGVPATEIAAVLGGRLELSAPDNPSIRAPGMLASHYAPRTPMELCSGVALYSRVKSLLKKDQKLAIILFSSTAEKLSGDTNIHKVVMPLQSQAYARQLYATMRTLDTDDYNRLLVESPPLDGEWLAIHDRLRRAAVQI